MQFSKDVLKLGMAFASKTFPTPSFHANCVALMSERESNSDSLLSHNATVLDLIFHSSDKSLFSERVKACFIIPPYSGSGQTILVRGNRGIVITVGVALLQIFE